MSTTNSELLTEAKEIKVLSEGLLKKFLGLWLTAGFIKGAIDRRKKESIKQQQKEISQTIKSDKELKLLMKDFSKSTSKLNVYLKKNKKKNKAYAELHRRLEQLY